MRYRIIIVCLLTCVCTYTACNIGKKSGEGDSVKNIHINLTDIDDQKPCVEYVDSVTFIPLETSDSCLIQRIANVQIIDNRIYVRDVLQGCIFVFNNQGKLIFKIDRLGRGPNEYSQMLGGCIDEQHIIVLGYSELVLYNKNNGEFVKKIRIPSQDFIPVGVYADSNNYYFLSADGFSKCKIQATVLVYNKKEFVFKQGYVDPFWFKERYYSSPQLIKSSYGLLFHQPLNDTLYRLGNDVFEPLFFLNTGKLQITYQMYEKLPLLADGRRQMPNKAISSIGNILFFDDWLYFVCYPTPNEKGYIEPYWCFYSLDSGEMKIFNRERIYKENNKYFVNFFDFDTRDADGYFYTVCHPSTLTRFRDKQGNLDERYNKMQESDNPWLMKYRLKL